MNVTLTLANLTTQTIPVYTDPEGDPVQDIRIITLPVIGVLVLNGVAVSIGDIITVADINAGNLVVQAPNQNAAASAVFDFAIRDTGSGQFSV